MNLDKPFPNPKTLQPVCANCRHWRQKDEQGLSYTGEQDFGLCKSNFVYRTSYGPNKEASPMGVLTCDEGGMTGELMTGAFFGCRHWEP